MTKNENTVSDTSSSEEMHQLFKVAQLAFDRTNLAESCTRDLVGRLYKESEVKQKKNAEVQFWMKETKKWKDTYEMWRR